MMSFQPGLHSVVPWLIYILSLLPTEFLVLLFLNIKPSSKNYKCLCLKTANEYLRKVSYPFVNNKRYVWRWSAEFCIINLLETVSSFCILNTQALPWCELWKETRQPSFWQERRLVGFLAHQNLWFYGDWLKCLSYR